MEALKLYLNIPKLIFVVGVDENVVNDLVKEHYKSHGLSEEKSRNYLAKMFQVEVRLAPSETEIEGFLDALLARSSAWKEIQDETARDVFRNTINRLGGRSPREIKRLINSSMLALAGTRLASGPSDAAGSAPTAVEQMQVFFVRQVLLKPQINRASLVGENRGTRFFTAWSKAIQNGAPRTLQVESRITELMEGTSDRSGGKSGVDTELEKLLEGVPEPYRMILRERTFAPFFNLLAERDLGELMRLPYSEEATTIGESLTAGTSANAIREAAARSLEMRLEEFGEKDFARVVKLDLNESIISDLEPLQAMTNLTSLSLAGTQIENLELLRALTNLEELILAGTQIEDLEPLRALKSLKRLDLDSTQIEDLGPLRALKSLEELSLDNTQVENLEPLRALTNLEELSFDHTQVENLEPLRALTNLEQLSFAGTQVKDLEPIQALTSLDWLLLAGTQVKDLKPIRALTSLDWLSLDRTQVENLEPIQALTNLTWLYLAGTQIEDLEPLRALTKLQRLILDDTQVEDLEPLRALTNLKSLRLDHTHVVNVDPIKTLPQLQDISLKNTMVADSAIADLQVARPDLKIIQE